MATLDPTVRRLTALEKTASSGRVLNLLAIHRRMGRSASYPGRPFFENRRLDRAIILKHRVRPNEMELFVDPPMVATKVIIPLDLHDLRLGGRYFFLDQYDFEDAAHHSIGDRLLPGSRDRQILDILGELPSLDPFLLREHLDRHGFRPSADYFSIAPSDLATMQAFVRQELSGLMKMGSQASAGLESMETEKLVRKLLSANVDEELEPLRHVLRLSENDYHDGLFAWRGFLYYKWVLDQLSGDLKLAIATLNSVRTLESAGSETSVEVRQAQVRVRRRMADIWQATRATLQVYDQAYRAMTEDQNASAFRDFLLSAPALFTQLGSQVGSLQSITGFVQNRFGIRERALIGATDLITLLRQFEVMLASESKTAMAA